jgi:hypothetical protein
MESVVYLLLYVLYVHAYPRPTDWAWTLLFTPELVPFDFRHSAWRHKRQKVSVTPPWYRRFFVSEKMSSTALRKAAEWKLLLQQLVVLPFREHPNWLIPPTNQVLWIRIPEVLIVVGVQLLMKAAKTMQAIVGALPLQIHRPRGDQSSVSGVLKHTPSLHTAHAETRGPPPPTVPRGQRQTASQAVGSSHS